MGQTPLAAQVTVFQGSTNTMPVETLPLADVLQRIQDGTYRTYVEQLRQLLANNGKGWYDDAKRHSMAFTPAGVFAKRANASLTTASRLVHFDFDHPDNLADAKARLMADPWVFYAFVSPSGDGLKVAVWADGIVDDATYKHAWNTVLEYFKRTYPDIAVANDKVCKDIARLCYMSWDPDLHVNPAALLYALPRYQPPAPKPKPKPQSISAPVATAPPSPSAPLPADRRQYHAQQAIDTAVKMIDASIPSTATSAGTRHETRLKASRLLGGYVAGGIVTYAEAYAALEAAVIRNTEHVSRSMQTITDGLAHGQQDAITLEDLEHQRQEWLQAHSATMVIHGRPLAPPTGNGTPPAPAAPQQTATAAASSTGTGSSQTHVWGTPGQQAPDPRPDIIIGPDITRIVDEAQTALLALPEAPVIYQRARGLCIIARGVKPPTWLHRPPDMSIILEASSAHLWELAGQAAKWWKLDKRSKKYELALPPRWGIEALQGRDGWLFPPLEGILHSPTLRPDGSVLDLPGYDSDTGLFFDSNGTTFPAIPLHPTLDDARTAIGHLQEAVSDFPFAEPWHFSSWLAGVLSIVCRYTIRGCVPMHGITATSPASGKGLLADIIAIIGTGRPAARWSQTLEETEEEKRILALALDGDPLICIDNVTAPLGSAVLAKTLTGPSVKGRILCKTQNIEAPMSAVFLCTGNNMQYVGDVARRVVPIALDPKMERPEERTGFLHPDLPQWVQSERPRLTVAALTIVKAYFEAGCPSQGVPPFGSFQLWSDLIRQSLVWAGEADPNEGRKDIEATNNPEFQALDRLLHTWYACYRTTPTLLKQAIQDIGLYAAQGQGQPGNQWNELQDALGTALDVCHAKHDGKTLRSEALGYVFRKWQGRVIDGMRFIQAGTQQRASKWRIEVA